MSNKYILLDYCDSSPQIILRRVHKKTLMFFSILWQYTILTLSVRVFFMKASMQLCVHDPMTTTSNVVDIFLQDSLLILKRPLQNYKKFLKKYVFDTIWAIVLSAVSDLQPHQGILPVAKGILLLMSNTT